MVVGSNPTGAMQAQCAKHGLSPALPRSDGGVRCKICARDAVRKRIRKVKRLLVDEAGGKCTRCGYDTCVAALHFHHRDPAKKSFKVGTGSRSLERNRAEAQKCDLLCANCHAEVHWTEDTGA